MNWCKKNFVIKYTQPVKPMQNGYIERFTHLFREDILEAYYFNDTYQLQKINDNWREDDNFNHPHKSLEIRSPKEFMPRFYKEFKFFIKSGFTNNYEF